MTIMSDAPESPVTRWSLLSRMVRSDEAAWAEFDRAYRPVIRDYVLSRGIPSGDADDVVQIVMTQVHRDLPELKRDPRHGRFKAWLKTKIRWRVEDWRAAAGRHRHEPEVADESTTGLIGRLPAQGEADPGESLDRAFARQLDAEVRQRISRRPRMRQEMLQAFLWKRHDGWTSERIRTALGVQAVETVDTWIHRVQKLYDAELVRLRSRWE